MNDQNKINKYKKKYFALKKEMENNQKKIEGGQKHIGGQSSTRKVNLELLKKYKEETTSDVLIRPIIPAENSTYTCTFSIEKISKIEVNISTKEAQYKINYKKLIDKQDIHLLPRSRMSCFKQFKLLTVIYIE